jgi:hypothetical protein
MRKFLIVVVVIAMLLVAAMLAGAAGAKQEKVCIHHEAQGQSDQPWTEWRPASSWHGHDGHTGDYIDPDGSECGELEPPIVIDPIANWQRLFMPIIATDGLY